MMPDIFSSFDPSFSKSFIPLTSLFLTMNMLIIISIPLTSYLSPNRILSSQFMMLNIIMSQLMRTSSKFLKGFSMIISSVFLMTIMINFMGMLPYSFSLSSHLIYTLSLGMPLWLSLILSSWVYMPKKSMAHLLPDGAPNWLNPFLVMIETTSILVRPITLSFRLAANMTAGHIVLSLLGIYCSISFFNTPTFSVILILLESTYILFELGICCIQSFIYCLLVSLYSDDHAY